MLPGSSCHNTLEDVGPDGVSDAGSVDGNSYLGLPAPLDDNLTTPRGVESRPLTEEVTQSLW